MPARRSRPLAPAVALGMGFAREQRAGVFRAAPE
jgi:hypothetical protein